MKALVLPMYACVVHSCIAVACLSVSPLVKVVVNGFVVQHPQPLHQHWQWIIRHGSKKDLPCRGRFSSQRCVAMVDEAPAIEIGTREDTEFRLDDSVYYWKDFESRGNDANVQQMRQILQENAISLSSFTKLSAAYWTSHLFRSGYFSLNALLGSVASDLHERYINKAGETSGDSSRSTDQTAAKSDPGPILAASQTGGMVSRLIDSDIPSRLLLETLKTFEQDFKWIEKGVLNYPWDALVQYKTDSDDIQFQFQHQQFNPFFVLSESIKASTESVAIFSRRNKGKSQGASWQSPRSNLYPDYYMNDFHYQTDGWLSTVSAQRYEVSTETLFLGRQDAMQRQTLLPLLRHENRPKTVLEVACGTGRFATFLRDNLPEADVTLSDLSPYYLEKARENDAYWRRFKGKDIPKKGDSVVKPAVFVQANAEQLPFEDNSFDAVVSIYLFHELPETARRRAAAEMVRVCKPGGTIVLTDSMQYGDRPKFQNIANFAKLNEPHYENYVQSAYLPDLFAGTECGEKFMASSTKTVSFVKKSIT